MKLRLSDFSGMPAEDLVKAAAFYAALPQYL